MFEDDFILRAVKQMAGALALVLGLRQAGQHEQAQQTLDEAYDGLLGPSREFLDGVDGSTLYRLVANSEVARALAAACAIEASLREQSGEHGKARQRGQQARDLWRAAKIADGGDDGATGLGEVVALLARLATV